MTRNPGRGTYPGVQRVIEGLLKIAPIEQPSHPMVNNNKRFEFSRPVRSGLKQELILSASIGPDAHVSPGTSESRSEHFQS